MKTDAKRDLLNQLIVEERRNPTSAVTRAEDVLPVLYKRGYHKKKQEHFIVVTLDGAHQVIRTRVCTIGLLNSTQIHPREVFKHALKDNACSIILAHNHPSGNLNPSEQDKQVTSQLRRAGEIMGIKVLDHLIICKTGHFYSFASSSDIW